MKLYTISQNVNNSYDTYDSAVVCAKDEESAKRIHPSDKRDIFYDEKKKQFVVTEIINSEARILRGTDDLSKIKVEYLGEAKEGSKSGVIVASFNIG